MKDMAFPEKSLDKASSHPLCKQMLSPFPMVEDSPCPDEGTSPQIISVVASEQDFKRWRSIGVEQKLSSDSKIAIFLISFYEKHKTAVSYACRLCQAPLPLTCTRCHDSSPLAQCSSTGASPIQDNGAQCFSPHQYNSGAWESQSTQADRDSLQAFGPCHPAENISQPVSQMTSDHQEPSLDASKGPSHSRRIPRQASAKRHLRTRTLRLITDKKRCISSKASHQSLTLKIKQKHSACKEGENTFKCQSCKAIFKKRFSLKKHVLSSHTCDSAFVCQLCGQLCSNSADLDAHTQAYHTLFQCLACTASFTNDVKYKAHVHKHHPGVKPHRCQHCDKAYTSKQSLIFHCQKMHADNLPQMDGILSSNINGRYQCRSCDAVFHRQGLLKVHVASHRSSVPFLCSVCGLSCCDKQDLDQHRFTHTPFQCPVCDARFAHNTKYVAHIRRQHPGMKAHKCPHCDRAFNTRKWLSVHLLKHTGERPHLCPECGKSFTEAQVLQRHRLAVHQGIRAYSCSTCHKTFKTSSALAYHRRSHREVKPCLCDGCGKTFLSSSALVVHKIICKVHNHVEKQVNCQAESSIDGVNVNSDTSAETLQRPFVCPDCGATFKGEQWLYRHRVNKPATCSKKFACEFCPRVFKDNRNLARHVRVHTGEKPFVCGVCKAKFTTRSDLHRHARTHSGVKPYACQHCDQLFRFRCDLTTHLRTHSGETPYPCPHCDSAFISASQRLQHIRTKHKSMVSMKEQMDGRQQGQTIAMDV